MTYTEEQKRQIRANIQRIIDYIEKEIFPHITYDYETGVLGSGFRLGLNGPYSEKIRFYYGNTWYNADIFVEDSPNCAVEFLQHWQDAKSYMNNEIKNNAEKIKLIENFEI